VNNLKNKTTILVFLFSFFFITPLLAGETHYSLENEVFEIRLIHAKQSQYTERLKDLSGREHLVSKKPEIAKEDILTLSIVEEKNIKKVVFHFEPKAWEKVSKITKHNKKSMAAIIKNKRVVDVFPLGGSFDKKFVLGNLDVLVALTGKEWFFNGLKEIDRAEKIDVQE